MIARDVMTRDVVSVTPDTPVRKVASLLVKHRIGAVPVIDDGGAPIGVSESDLPQRACRHVCAGDHGERGDQPPRHCRDLDDAPHQARPGRPRWPHRRDDRLRRSRARSLGKAEQIGC